MTNIGETLRTAREEQGLSINDAVAETRIRSHFLEALEQNNFESLGGDIYVRGFLRNYATFLGLDPDPLLAPFRSEEHKLPVYQPRSQPRYLAEPLQSNPVPIGRIFTMVLVLLLLGLIGFSLWVRPVSFDSILAFLPTQNESSAPATIDIEPISSEENEDSQDVASESPTATTESEAETEEESEAQVEATATEPSESAAAEPEATETTEVEDESAASATPTLNPSPTVAEEVATAVPTATLPPRTSTPAATDATATPTETPEPTSTPTAVPTDEGVVIQAQILADTWVRVFVDNESGEAIQRTAAPGETFEWIGQESVNLRAGNGAALNLTVNGEEYGVAGGSGQVVDLRWERDPAGGSPVIVQQ